MRSIFPEKADRSAYGKREEEQKPKDDIDRQTDYYKLKTQAVRDLVEADESNSPEVSEEELDAYRSGPRLKVAGWVKLLFVKAWFAGAVCFFFIWGLGGYLAGLWDMLFVTGMALGIVTDLLTNNVLRFFEKTPGENDRFMMFPKNGYGSFLLNILYAYVVLFFVYNIYNLINLAAITVTGAKDVVYLGVEPVLFGVFCLGVDMFFIKIKHLFFEMIRDVKKKPVR